MQNLFLGGDVSKGYADFVLIDHDRNIIEECFRLDDNAKGHGALEVFLRRLVVQYPDALIHFGVESTGGYESNWLEFAMKMSKALPVCSARINPCGIKKYMDAELKRTITDKVSAECIAQYMIAHPDKVLYDQHDPFYSLRREWTSLCLLKKGHTQFTNNLHSLLYTANPGVLIYCRKGIPGWLLQVLAQYPTSSALANARLPALAKIKHVGPCKAESLKRYAQTEIASTDDLDMAFTIKLLLQQIRSIAVSIDSIEKHLAKKWADHPSINLIASINGIGVISSIGLLINIRDIKLFPSVKHLASYFGLHPIWKQSGDGSWGFHMSKIGRSQPRAILFMTTLSAIIYNPIIKKLYAACLHNKMEKMAAVGVCMHKMLRIVYGILRTEKPFDPVIDDRNKTKSVTKSPEETEKQYQKKLRRFQVADLKAPISNRQAKKRRGAMGPKTAVPLSAGSPRPYKNIVHKKSMVQEVL